MLRKCSIMYRFPKLCLIDKYVNQDKHYMFMSRIIRAGGECFLNYINDNYILIRGGNSWVLERVSKSNGYYYMLFMSMLRNENRITFSIEHCDLEPNRRKMHINISMYKDVEKLKALNGSYLYLEENESNYNFLMNLFESIYTNIENICFLDMEISELSHLTGVRMYNKKLTEGDPL